MNEQVKKLVLNQLREAGFDPDLSAGALPSLQASRMSMANSYEAAAAKESSGAELTESVQQLTADQRKEAWFWECRRSLRLWPVSEANRGALRSS